MAKDTRQKLVETAKDLIGASSYASVSVAEICKRTGVNKGSFYHFFESKEGLALEALENWRQEARIVLDEVFDLNKTSDEQLDKFVQCFYEHAVEEFGKYGKVLGCPAVNLGSEMATQSQHFCESVDNIFKSYDKYFIACAETLIKEGKIDKSANAEKLGKIAHTYILGLKITLKIENSPLIFKDELKSILLRIYGVK